MRWVSLILVASACGGLEGEVQVAAWGERSAVEGYRPERTDGWDITLESFHSGIGPVSVLDRSREEAVATLDGAWVVDWTTWPEPAPLGVLAAPADRYRVAFDLVVPSSDTAPIGEVDPDIVAEMAANGWAHHVVGQATDGERTVRFAWGFDNPARSTECENGIDGTDGIAVSPDLPARLQITMHADHLFWNTLRTEESPIAFAGIAGADADRDGEVTVAELQAADPVALGYEAAGVELTSVYAFIRYSLARAAHLNGGGLCRVQAL